ncbi:hypothetical protein CALVIDRAFT_2727 [Calocera viscosa TUFC12733]|uniref:Uncharacterized protein n=1 Tax=Calocera viscosa (strain TUFC12733) TaxID=1330018 RepID=A0A167RYY7_CALVF|nr:hypothetical protein CALVIDRAFT_2727 [Calocera viscosa TUFC12733]
MRAWHLLVPFQLCTGLRPQLLNTSSYLTSVPTRATLWNDPCATEYCVLRTGPALVALLPLWNWPLVVDRTGVASHNCSNKSFEECDPTTRLPHPSSHKCPMPPRIASQDYLHLCDPLPSASGLNYLAIPNRKAGS